MREFSFRAILLGIIVGALLAAANAFVGLKVGMTISASIPAAVISLLVMRKLLRSGTLLESNMVQTVGSAGESAAAGMIFTIPALFIMGDKPEYLEMVIWGGIGGLLGVCFMVPLRQILIVKEHGVLPFPEGVACAEVLESGERGGAGAKSVIWGAIVGAVFYLFSLLGLWNEKGKIAIDRFHTEAQLESSPALLGVGYILGARVAGYMLAGAVFSWFILIPAIAFFGSSATAPIFPEKSSTIAAMTPEDFYNQYIRFIGAGAVAIGGLIALFKSIGTISGSLWHVIKGLFAFRRAPRPQTEKDFPLPLLILIIAGLGYAMWHFEQVNLDPIGVIAVLVFAFFFVTVSARLVGIVGNSSNPISGMTIATLLGTALVYKFFVMDRAGEMSADDIFQLKVTCLSVGAIVCIALSIAGDTSQDLKTGFLVKATPYKQQTGEMIGVLTSVVAIAGVILLLNNTIGFVKTADHPHPLPAFQANIMKLLADGVLGGQVPWTLIMIGGASAVVVEMLGLPALPFAVGMYLPLGLSTPIMLGGLIAWVVQRKRKTKADHDAGVLTASGLVAGQGLIGVALAGLTAFISWWWAHPRWMNPLAGTEEPVSPLHFGPWLMNRFDWIPMKWGLSEAWWDALPMLPFVPLVIWLWWCARKRPVITLPPDANGVAAPPKPAPRPTPFVPPLAKGDEKGDPRQTSSPPVETEPPPEPAPPESCQPQPDASSDSDTAPRPLPPTSEITTTPAPEVEESQTNADNEPTTGPYDERQSPGTDAYNNAYPVSNDETATSEPQEDDFGDALRDARRRLEELGPDDDAEGNDKNDR